MNSSFILCLLLYINVGLCYRPVVLIHGILTGAESMLVIEEEIKRVRLRLLASQFVIVETKTY